jgi:hypothetical protein
MLFIGGAIFIIVTLILFIDHNIYDTLAYIFYGINDWDINSGPYFVAPNIKGSHSWLQNRPFRCNRQNLPNCDGVGVVGIKYLSGQLINITNLVMP